MVSGASSHATTHKTLCSTNAWAGFWPELSVPRRLHHHKCSSWAGSSSCSHSILSCSLYGRKVAESFTLLFVCLQTPHCLKALLQVSIVFMAKLCSMKFHFIPFFLFLYMIFVFGKQLQISLVVFCNIAVIIAYTVNYTKNDLMEVIY